MWSVAVFHADLPTQGLAARNPEVSSHQDPADEPEGRLIGRRSNSTLKSSLRLLGNTTGAETHAAGMTQFLRQRDDRSPR